MHLQSFKDVLRASLPPIDRQHLPDPPLFSLSRTCENVSGSSYVLRWLSSRSPSGKDRTEVPAGIELSEGIPGCTGSRGGYRCRLEPGSWLGRMTSVILLRRRSLPGKPGTSLRPLLLLRQHSCPCTAARGFTVEALVTGAVLYGGCSGGAASRRSGQSHLFQCSPSYHTDLLEWAGHSALWLPPEQ